MRLIRFLWFLKFTDNLKIANYCGNISRKSTKALLESINFRLSNVSISIDFIASRPMDFSGSHLFLFLNASIVWFVVAAVMMKLCRLKSLVLVLIIAPFVIGSTFRHIAGMPQLMGFYGTSILYGAVGIIGGMLYVEYARAKAYFQKASKLAFLARGMIALSSLYMLSFFAQKIILQNPMVEFALSWIDGGERAKQLLSIADYNGAYLAGAGILSGFGLLAFSAYRSRQSTPNQSPTQNHLEPL